MQATVSLPLGSLPAPVLSYLERQYPGLSTKDREQKLHAILADWLEPEPTRILVDLIGRGVEAVIERFWRYPTRQNAEKCLAEVRSALTPRLERERVRQQQSDRPSPLAQPLPIGPYLADAYLGEGGDGIALHARHQVTRLEVAIKITVRGDLAAYQVLGDDWPPSILRIHAACTPANRDERGWIAREYADGGTLADLLHQRKGRALSEDEALSILSVCCEGVSWLHQHHIYRWSAHTKNVFRCGDRWKIGDLGRCVFFLPPEHHGLETLRAGIVATLGEDRDAASVADWILSRVVWGHPASVTAFPLNPEREHRLSVDDCSALAGLLVDLMAPGRRYRVFSQAISGRPYCSAHYRITGAWGTDHQLSNILNRAWRGDEGGAPLLANQGKGEQSVYDDPLELLHDVQALF